MHVKTMIFDQKIVLTGSPNMTHNGIENNREHLYNITGDGTLEESLEDFNNTWNLCQDVNPAVIDLIKKYGINAEVRTREQNPAAEV